MALINEAWGWGGWVIYALLPLSFWAFIIFVLVLVFRRSATVELPAREPSTSQQTARDARSEPSALGWFPPVAQHH